MSHAATNWAIKQRGLKPATKIVLFYLADRHNPDYGCFPSLDTLADDCEMSRRSVQHQIDILIEKGLVSVEKMPRSRGHMPRNRYVFSFEMDATSLGQNLPMAKSALGKNDDPPLAKSATSLGQNLPTNLVKEPCKEPCKAARGKAEVMQDRIVEALGLTGREMNTSGTFVVKGMDVHNLTASLEVWAKHGLTDDQIILAIRAKLEVERSKSAGFLPGSLKFFDGPIADFAKRMADGTVPRAAEGQGQAPPTFANPEAEAEYRTLMAELESLRGSNSDKAFDRRGELIRQLQKFQTAA